MSVGQTTGETYLFKVMRGSSNPDVNENRYAQMADQIRAVVESRGLKYFPSVLKRQSYNHGGLMLQVKYILDPGHTGPVAPEPAADQAEPPTGDPQHSIETKQVWNGMWRAACSCGEWSLFVPQEQEALNWADAHSRRTATQQEESDR